MTLISGIIKELSVTTHMEEKTITTYARFMREGGLLSQKGRGRGAAHATPLDAARLLIALMINCKAKDVCQAVKDFGGMILVKSKISDDLIWPNANLDNLCKIKNVHTLEESFAAIINGWGAADFVEVMEKEVSNSNSRHYPPTVVGINVERLTAALTIGGYKYYYCHQLLADSQDYDISSDRYEQESKKRLELYNRYGSGIQRSCTIGNQNLQYLGEVIAGVRDPGERESLEEWVVAYKKEIIDELN